MATFYSWQISPLRGLARDEAVAGRLQATAPVELRDLNDASQRRAGAGPFELLGPGDVSRLAPGIISRRFPAPGAVDAEETKAALVEFNRPGLLDLPWRYSPQTDRPTGLGRGLRPWLVLVVGESGEVIVAPDGHVTLSVAVQSKHQLAGSWRWAHLHEVDGVSVARLLCPADLDKERYYTACLVPAFLVDSDGTLRDAWPAPDGGGVRLPCYDSWSFRTGPEGDFPQLAAKLHAANLDELGPAFGRASLRYNRRGVGQPSSAKLPMQGALQRPPSMPLEADPLEPWIASEVAALTATLPTPDGRWILTAPSYHKPFTPPATGAAAGWATEVADDPRRRGAAGLGAWAGIAWQDRIADGAATKAGDLAIARDRIGHLALGLEASRSLWRRHVPADPIGQLALLGPVLGRLPAASGGTVLDAIAGRTPLLARALWSSAARRALRRGPARSALAQPGASRFDEILRVASRCPGPNRDPDIIPIGREVDPADQIAAAKDAILAAGASDPDFAREVADRLLTAGAPPPGLLAAVLAALDPGGGERPDRDAVLRLLDGGEAPPVDQQDLSDLIDELQRLNPRPKPCRAIDPAELGRRVAAAVDPTVPRPVVVERVLGTLPGIKDIGPIELEPELDLPLWRFLADACPDWLLPGVGDLRENDVVALATNPSFVQAMLVGANHQTLGELRWRNVPIAARWSPLRKFWHRRGGDMDITPIGGWPAASMLGGAGLQPPGAGVEAVVVFRTQLFRRYPGTVVYLYADVDWTPPPANVPLVDSQKVWPSFTGMIGDDVVFFGFPVAPSALASHWVVLEEPPAGYRFYTESQSGQLIGQIGATAADYGYETFAVPVRVMIGKLLEAV